MLIEKADMDCEEDTLGDNVEAEPDVKANPPPLGDIGVVFIEPDRKILYKAGK